MYSCFHLCMYMYTIYICSSLFMKEVGLIDAPRRFLWRQELLPAAVPQFGSCSVVDSHVMRFPSAVSWFSPGSYELRPTLGTAVPNLVCAGDWVRMGAREHGAKGLCQERALVSGLEAANLLARRGVVKGREHEVIKVREDELQVELARSANKGVAGLLKGLGLLASPWVR